MKAFVYSRYGSPDVLSLQDLPKPTPQPDQVVIRVRAASLNPLDWHIMRADPALVRLTNGLLKPKQPINIPGADVAGVIEAVGENVTGFAVGDAVFAGVGEGACAEYVCARAKNVAHKPQNLSFEEAAAVPVAAVSALQSLRRGGDSLAGRRVLVNGASGGVGTFMVQIAKLMGAHVTAVCSARNIALVRGLGADVVMDYGQQDPSRTAEPYHMVLDNVGNFSLGGFRRTLTPTGIGLSVGFTSVWRLLANTFGQMLTGWRTQQKVSPFLASVSGQDLEALKPWLSDGRLRVVIDRTYPFDQTPDALRYLETGRARGKVVLTVG
ncbi:MAG: NAD(P)-dependent alcohol dehydrogenase [Anaerolineae bacterium]|nr:NAD(P)-dependent alcohol dehydrogenase [Anaerolineae bacterium]